MTTVPAFDAELPTASDSGSGLWRRFRANTPALLAAVALVGLVVVVVVVPFLSPHDPNHIDLRAKFESPSWSHWLGTDNVGRDVFTRLVVAGRVSLIAPVIATATSVALGLPAGLLAGYFGGRVDLVLSRIADLIMTLPTLIVSIAVIAVIGPGLRNAMLVYGVMMATRLFRIVRAAVLSVSAETYIEASVSMGTSRSTILLRHVIPNIRAPFLVELSFMMAVAMMAEASLSFLGLGVVPPTPSWGQMLARAFRDIYNAPSLIWPPGICILVTALAFNLVADGLRDAYGREEHRG